jgi:hypothetical protein
VLVHESSGSAIYTPASYDTFSRPAKGASYTDAVFGCSVKTTA